jgi:hypothetical protein
MFVQFLGDVVTEDVLGQLQEVGQNLAEHTVLFIAVGRLDFLLQESRTVLITAKFYNVAIYVLNSRQ